MSRFSFLSIPKAEAKHINAVAAKYLRTNFPSSYHRSISFVKAIPLSVSQTGMFGRWCWFTVPLGMDNSLRQCLMPVQNLIAKHHIFFTFPSQLLYIFRVSFG